MFKVFINDGQSEPPQDDIFYIIGKNGIFLRKKLGKIDAIIPVDQISVLGDVQPMAQYDLPPIPRELFAKVVAFFKEIYKEHHSEAIVLVHYNEETDHFKLQCPHQSVSHGGLDYIRTITYPGYTKVCTIHSHAGMSAFHSGIDDKDEEDTDGLHITVGHLGWDEWEFDLSVSVVFNGKRFMADAHTYIDGLADIEHEETSPIYGGWYSIYFTSLHDDEEKVTTKPGFVIDLPESKMTFDQRWLDYVTVKSGYRRFPSIISSLKTHKTHYSRNQEIINKLNSDDAPEILSDEHEYNPCEKCIFAEYKLLQEIEDDGLDIDDIEGIEDIEGLSLFGGTELNYRPDNTLDSSEGGELDGN